jgi:hypothetical protein
MKGRTKGSFTSMESFCLNTLDAGSVFYTIKKDKDITAIASYYGRKVLTERYVCIDQNTHTQIEHLTKVTLI